MEKELEDCRQKAVKNQDLWKELDSLVSEFRIELIKVKGHSGDVYNEG